jgi:hypothetical protein
VALVWASAAERCSTLKSRSSICTACSPTFSQGAQLDSTGSSERATEPTGSR